MRIRQSIAKAKEKVENVKTAYPTAVETVKKVYALAVAALVVATFALLIAMGRGRHAV